MILHQWIPLLKNHVSAEKKDCLDCCTIVPVTIEESCKRIQKHKMDKRYNVNTASALGFQITYHVQYQFHKIFPSVLTKAGRWGSRDNCSPNQFLLSFLKTSLQEIQFWLWPFNLGKVFCLCLEARNFKIFSATVGWFTKDCLSKQLVLPTY